MKNRAKCPACKGAGEVWDAGQWAGDRIVRCWLCLTSGWIRGSLVERLIAVLEQDLGREVATDRAAQIATFIPESDASNEEELWTDIEQTLSVAQLSEADLERLTHWAHAVALPDWRKL